MITGYGTEVPISGLKEGHFSTSAMLSHSVFPTGKGRNENIVRRFQKKMLCQKQLISEPLAVVTWPDKKTEGCDFQSSLKLTLLNTFSLEEYQNRHRVRAL